MSKQELNRDQWNERLDENLEGRKESDPQADENADEFSEKYGTEKLRNSGTLPTDSEDNMKINQPKPGTPKDGEIEREE